MTISTLDLPLASIHQAIAPATPHLTEITPHILQQCSEIYFRQSLLKDYLGCPHRTLYRWIAGFEEESTTFAAYLGTAGHKVLYDWHQQRRKDADVLWVMSTFEKAFYDELAVRQIQPRIGTAYTSIEEHLHAEMPYYTELITTYMRNKRNLEFHSTMHEQSFVLVVPNPRFTRFRDTHPDATLDDLKSVEKETAPPYLFTGQIDQAGFYDDGTFVLRDIKFRDNAFKPSKKELSLDTQLTTYAAALKWGFPACQTCKPSYELDDCGSKTLHYNGPCEACKAKIATPQWPLRYAERCEMIWMYGFETYKKDQHEKEVADRTAPKVKNSNNRAVFAKKINPDWVSGYKKGDEKGPGILNSHRTPASLEVLLGDLLRICDDIRAGRFYRRPSDQCNWCPHQEACATSLKIQVQEIDYAKIQTFGTEDPF